MDIRGLTTPMLVLLVSASFLGAGPRGTPAVPPAPLQQALDMAASEALSHGATEIGAVVLRGDAVVAARHEHAIVPLASLSKQLWATAIVQLAAAGAVDLDGPVRNVLGAFPEARVRVRDLLQQTSGLGDDFDGEDDDSFSDHPAFAFPAGTFWRYSNRGALVAKRLLEVVARKPWSVILAQRIAGPIGLPSMRVCSPKDGPGLPATTMQRVGFVCSDALDTARFERALDQGRLIPPSWLARMRAPVVLALGGGHFPLGYGWFTRLGEVDGHRAYGHTGGFPGVSVAAFSFPTDGLTLAVLERGSPAHGFTATALLTDLARAALGLPAPTIDRQASPPAALLAAVPGDYDLDGGAILRITTHDGQLWAEIAGRTPPMKILWAGGSSFLGSPEGYDADEPTTFLIVGNRAVGLTWGHRLLLDSVALRRNGSDAR